ncbi:MAG: prephenate dehydratase [Lachnospiraceae bacterium]
MDLTEIRKEIDGIDRQIVALFEERMKLSSKVAEYKRSVGKPIWDKQREKEKIETLVALTGDEFNQRGIEELFTQIMTISRLYQYQLLAGERQTEENSFQEVEQLPVHSGTRVYFQGVPGAYSEQALEQFFGSDVQRYHVETFKEIMEKVQSGEADYGILPIENSTAGTVGGIYELLMEYENLTIVGQEYVRVQHNLLGVPGSSLETIKKVYSHPQGLLQSAPYLESHAWEQVEVKNTAIAAQKVKTDNDITKAAVASRRAAELYGLDVLEEGINQSHRNETRFIVLANKRFFQRTADKISISFAIPHESGSLYNILAHFIFNGVNMNHIESRPLKGKQWEYRFFIDIDGNLTDSNVKNALHGIASEATEFRIIGNYQ